MACDTCNTWQPMDHWQAPVRATATTCAQVRCMACDALVCFSRGMGRGCCPVCYFGRLPGWSFGHVPKTCQYKGCDEPAVYAYLPGQKRHCCKTHGDKVLTRR